MGQLVPNIRSYILPVGLPVAVSVTGGVSAITHGAIRAFCVILATVCIGGTAVYNKSKQNQARSATEEAARARVGLAVTLTSAGQVLIRALGRVSAAKTAVDRDSALHRLIEKVVETARSQCGRDPKTSNRASFYEKRANQLVLAYFD